MAAAADALLAVLPPGVREDASFAFDDDAARHDWHYIPRRRGGVAFAAMTAAQQKVAYDLVASGLSLPAYAAVATIIGLEDVLDRLEAGAGPRRRGSRPVAWGRHRGDYSTSLFGSPGRGAPWGWRFEGHHVSLNVTVVGDSVSAAPLFLGANPAEVLAASGAVVARPLAGEEDLALRLLAALTPAARTAAFLRDQVPDDILTGALPEVTSTDELNAGVALGDLDASGRGAAVALIRHYIDRLPPDLAGARWAMLEPDLGATRFGFAGEAAHRRPHYYRLAGPDLLIEYDNVQNEANHVHTVIRAPRSDFGRDLLRDHRAAHHAG